MYIDSLYPCKQEYTLDYVQRLQMMYKTGDYFDNAQWFDSAIRVAE